MSGIAEVARFLAVIAGEHAEAAGVDRQRLVQRELGGEVGDRPVGVGIAVLPPGVRARCAPRRARRRRRRRRPGTARRWPPASSMSCDTLPQHQHRVVRGLPPERVIELAEHLARLRVPGPPQIVGEFGQAAAAARESRGSQLSGAFGVRGLCVSRRFRLGFTARRARADELRRSAPDRCCRRRRRRRPCWWPRARESPVTARRRRRRPPPLRR